MSSSWVTWSPSIILLGSNGRCRGSLDQAREVLEEVGGERVWANARASRRWHVERAAPVQDLAETTRRDRLRSPITRSANTWWFVHRRTGSPRPIAGAQRRRDRQEPTSLGATSHDADIEVLHEEGGLVGEHAADQRRVVDGEVIRLVVPATPFGARRATSAAYFGFMKFSRSDTQTSSGATTRRACRTPTWSRWPPRRLRRSGCRSHARTARWSSSLPPLLGPSPGRGRPAGRRWVRTGGRDGNRPHASSTMAGVSRSGPETPRLRAAPGPCTIGHWITAAARSGLPAATRTTFMRRGSSPTAPAGPSRRRAGHRRRTARR